MEPNFIGKIINDSYIIFPHKLKRTAKAYLGKKIITNERIVIKFEPKYLNNLEKENDIYKVLKDMERIPKVFWYGDHNRYSLLIVQLLGPSLKKIFKDFCHYKFSLGTILNISLQMISILEQIHRKGVILRYIKPSNMVIGLKENKNKIYFIDFEYAKKYIKKGKHIDNVKARHIKGNIIYISANALRGNKTSRRDDIESLCYNIIYYMKGGKLPWSNENNMIKLASIKMDITLDELCEGLPEEIKLFIKYAKEMEFYQEPDYEYLKSLLLKIAEKNNIDVNKVEFDWENNKYYNNYIKSVFEENEKEFFKNIHNKKSSGEKNNNSKRRNRIMKKVKYISENNNNKNELRFLKFMFFIYLFFEYHWFFSILLFFITFD